MPLVINTIKLPDRICVFQKDHKTLTSYNLVTEKISHQKIEIILPHNFQMVQVGAASNPRVFVIGGGDNYYDPIPESMF